MTARPPARRDIRLIVGAVGISAIGDFLLWVPLTLHLQAVNASGIAVAGLFIALWSPVVLLAPVAGHIVDRFEARTLLIIASAFQAVVAAGLGLAVDSTSAVLVFAALLGCGFAVAQPAEFALVPVVSGDRDLTKVNGYVETARYSGTTLGPLLGGVIAGLGGTELALFINAGTFAVVALAAVALTARRPGQVAQPDAPRERARDGITYLFRDRTLALVLAVAFVSLLFMSASITAEVFFLKQDLEVSDEIYGLVFASWAVGMVMGALVVSRRVAMGSLALAALVATGVQGIGLGLPTAWLVVGFGAAMWFIGGVGHGTKNVLLRTLIQQRVPDRLHGRAFAAYNGMRNGAELIALGMGGLLVAGIGARTTLALAGAIPLLAVLAALVRYATMKDNGPAAGVPATEPVTQIV